jgi:trans-2,3-dihydro-3-hydroxyanthranilate isomerase
MKRRYFILDVFTDRRFAGNPLAVVLEADGLDPQQMQAVANEFNLPETVFVLPPEEGRARSLSCEPGQGRRRGFVHAAGAALGGGRTAI